MTKLHNQKTLGAVDVFAKQLHTALVDRNLTDIVDIIFVSDHGMTDTSHPEPVYVDDILGEDGVESMEHVDGTFPKADSREVSLKHSAIRLAVHGHPLFTRY